MYAKDRKGWLGIWGFFGGYGLVTLLACYESPKLDDSSCDSPFDSETANAALKMSQNGEIMLVEGHYGTESIRTRAGNR